MTILQVITLAVVEGLTEFIPVSSTGHLIIAEKLLGWQVPFSFDLIIQLGAYSAVLVYFAPKLRQMIVGVLKYAAWKLGLQKTKLSLVEWGNAKLGIFLVLGAIPAAIVGLLFDSTIEKYLHTGVFVSLIMIVFGLVMWYLTTVLGYIKNWVM